MTTNIMAAITAKQMAVVTVGLVLYVVIAFAAVVAIVSAVMSFPQVLILWKNVWFGKIVRAVRKKRTPPERWRDNGGL